MKIPERYLPDILNVRDKKKQHKNLLKSRKLYKKGTYYKRPNVKSFKTKPSNHVTRAKKMYNINNMRVTRKMSRATGCSGSALRKIVNKGRGAYYSGGSRPNQTPDSWGYARLASSITGGNASIVDYHILHESCKPGSKALQLARKTCKKQGKCQKYTK
jgi:hypothetical protein|tara:strand:- start:2793 stop:3269 length:477 start_codon:yes stop_codon:yes gene_type:complete